MSAEYWHGEYKKLERAYSMLFEFLQYHIPEMKRRCPAGMPQREGYVCIRQSCNAEGLCTEWLEDT